MKGYLLNPIQKVFLGRAYSLEKHDGFGGFCKCGGIMRQKGWVDEWLMVVECENCWRIEAFVYENRRFVERFELEVVSLRDFLNEVLTGDEMEALLNKANGKICSLDSFEKAKRKLDDLGFELEEVLYNLRGAELS